ESTKPAGSIVEQSPEANEKRKKEKEMIISVKVSSGKSSVTLENYTDWDVAVAKVKLEMLGVKVNVIEKYVEGKEPKKVLSQDPAGGTAVGSGDLVTLYVSRANVTASEGTTTEDKNNNANKQTSKPTNTKAPESSTKPTEKPVTDPTKAPAEEPTKKPAEEPTKKPAADPTKKPATAKPDPTQKPDPPKEPETGNGGTTGVED
ncbi:MAG: PASTA domain-containing protein, partial [Oscillospiraceae bacterium]